jgi:hypothetical protein
MQPIRVVAADADDDAGVVDRRGNPLSSGQFSLKFLSVTRPKNLNLPSSQ